VKTSNVYLELADDHCAGGRFLLRIGYGRFGHSLKRISTPCGVVEPGESRPDNVARRAASFKRHEAAGTLNGIRSTAFRPEVSSGTSSV
jgi:hypothetical protein